MQGAQKSAVVAAKKTGAGREPGGEEKGVGLVQPPDQGWAELASADRKRVRRGARPEHCAGSAGARGDRRRAAGQEEQSHGPRRRGVGGEQRQGQRLEKKGRAQRGRPKRKHPGKRTDCSNDCEEQMAGSGSGPERDADWKLPERQEGDQRDRTHGMERYRHQSQENPEEGKVAQQAWGQMPGPGPRPHHPGGEVRA